MNNPLRKEAKCIPALCEFYTPSRRVQGFWVQGSNTVLAPSVLQTFKRSSVVSYVVGDTFHYSYPWLIWRVDEQRWVYVRYDDHYYGANPEHRQYIESLRDLVEQHHGPCSEVRYPIATIHATLGPFEALASALAPNPWGPHSRTTVVTLVRSMITPDRYYSMSNAAMALDHPDHVRMVNAHYWWERSIKRFNDRRNRCRVIAGYKQAQEYDRE